MLFLNIMNFLNCQELIFFWFPLWIISQMKSRPDNDDLDFTKSNIPSNKKCVTNDPFSSDDDKNEKPTEG